jgi:broad specificity phosphatase PhoE
MRKQDPFKKGAWPAAFAFAALFALLAACDDSSSSTSAGGDNPPTYSESSVQPESAADPAESANSTGSAESTDSKPADSASSPSTESSSSAATSPSHETTSSANGEPASSADQKSSRSMSSPASSATQATSSAAEQPAEVTLDKDGFATVADVYHSLAPTEKAVFIIRHSEREDAVTIETELTANGVKMAQDLGATLKSDEEFSYITSGFVRTNETANNISKGRGEASLPKLITNYDITGNWFLKISADSLAQYGTALGMKGGSVELMSHWAYGEPYADVLYELEPKAEEFMQAVILKNLPKWKRVSIMVSHDIFVMPLAVFGSQKKVALKYYEDYHWINYIAGLAIIADEQNNLRYIPVKGAESGVIDYLAIYMEEYNKKK